MFRLLLRQLINWVEYQRSTPSKDAIAGLLSLITFHVETYFLSTSLFTTEQGFPSRAAVVAKW